MRPLLPAPPIPEALPLAKLLPGVPDVSTIDTVGQGERRVEVQ
jgi:hypothetical protein